MATIPKSFKPGVRVRYEDRVAGRKNAHVAEGVLLEVDRRNGGKLRIQYDDVPTPTLLLEADWYVGRGWITVVKEGK